MIWVFGSMAGIWTATSAACEFLELKAVAPLELPLDASLLHSPCFFSIWAIFGGVKETSLSSPSGATLAVTLTPFELGPSPWQLTSHTQSQQISYWLYPGFSIAESQTSRSLT